MMKVFVHVSIVTYLLSYHFSSFSKIEWSPHCKTNRQKYLAFEYWSKLFHIFLCIEILILLSFGCFIYKVLEQNAEEHTEFQPKRKAGENYMKINFTGDTLHQLTLGLFKARMRLVGHTAWNLTLRYEAYTTPFFGSFKVIGLFVFMLVLPEISSCLVDTNMILLKLFRKPSFHVNGPLHFI